MSNDNDCFQQYLGDLTTQAQEANGQPAASAGPGTVSGQSSLRQRPTNASPEDLPSGAAQQSGEAEGQSTGPSGDSEAVASLHMKEGLQQDTGNSETKTAKVAAKLRSQDLQEKNRKAQRRFRERQKVLAGIHLPRVCEPVLSDSFRVEYKNPTCGCSLVRPRLMDIASPALLRGNLEAR